MTPKRELAKAFIYAFKAEHGNYPTVLQAVEGSGFSRIVVEPALAAVMAANKEVKFTKNQTIMVDARVKLLSKKLESEFEERVRLAMLERNESYRAGLERMKEEASKKVESYTKLINNYKAIFTAEEFKLLLMCLHPDGERSKEKLEAAFKLLNEKKYPLTKSN